jgi:hypothetical protein
VRNPQWALFLRAGCLLTALGDPATAPERKAEIRKELDELRTLMRTLRTSGRNGAGAGPGTARPERL